MPFCMNCGTKLPDGAKFCMSCGTPLGQTGAAPGPAEPACACSEKRGTMAWIEGQGLYTFSEGKLCHVSEEKKQKLLLIEHAYDGDHSWIGAYKGKLYYFFSRVEDGSSFVCYASYDPRDGKETLISRDVPYRFLRNSGGQLVLNDGIWYGINDNDELFCIDAESGRGETREMPPLTWEDMDDVWRAELGAEPGYSSKGWIGLSAFGRYGYASKNGCGEHTIQFLLEDPSKFRCLPFCRGASCCLKEFNLFDVYKDELVTAGSSSVEVLPLEEDGFGAPLVHSVKTNVNGWWRCGSCYLMPNGDSSSNRTELLSMSDKKLYFIGIWLPGSRDFLTLPDGSVYLLAEDGDLYHFSQDVLKRTENFDLEKYVAADRD